MFTSIYLSGSKMSVEELQNELSILTQYLQNRDQLIRDKTFIIERLYCELESLRLTIKELEIKLQVCMLRDLQAHSRASPSDSFQQRNR